VEILQNNDYITFVPRLTSTRGRWKELRYRCEIDRNQLSFETKKNAIETVPSGKEVDRNAYALGRLGPVEDRRLMVNLTTAGKHNGDVGRDDQPIGLPSGH
jgi:hypothetical protein